MKLKGRRTPGHLRGVLTLSGDECQGNLSGKIGVKIRFKEGTVAKGKYVLGKNLKPFLRVSRKVEPWSSSDWVQLQKGFRGTWTLIK